MVQREAFPKSVLKRESDLQGLFRTWGDRFKLGWSVAGAPSWLRGLGNPLFSSEVEFSTTHGGAFRPDLLFVEGSDVLVVELKLAFKYEPIALPEVLHHVWVLENDEQARSKLATLIPSGVRHAVPVLITQTSWWLRAGVAYMRQHGMNPTSIRHLEFETFRDGERNILWVGDPLAAWEQAAPNDVPACLREAFPSYTCWYHVPGEDSWFATSTPQEPRPPFIRGKYVEAASLDAKSHEYLACEGEFGDRWRYLLLA